MTIDRVVLMFAGTVILASLLLSQLHHVNWLWLTAFVGANLLQSSITGVCSLPASFGVPAWRQDRHSNEQNGFEARPEPQVRTGSRHEPVPDLSGVRLA